MTTLDVLRKLSLPLAVAAVTTVYAAFMVGIALLITT